MTPWQCLPIVVAHVGGIPTLADFDTPDGVNNVVDQSFVLRWQDNELDMTGKFQFFFQPHNVPPNASVNSGDLVGTAIPCSGGAQCDTMEPGKILIIDTGNQMTWDTSAVPAGSYVVYSITTDAPLPPIYSMAGGVITVQHPGDPLHPAVVVTNPGQLVAPVADTFALKWQASGVGPFTAKVRWKPQGDGPFMDLADDLPMSEAPGGTHRGCYLWNLSGQANGYYFVEVEVTDGAGRTHNAFGRSSVTVFRDPNPTDAGVPASCEEMVGPDAGPAADGGGPGGDDEGEPGPCACRAGGRRGGHADADAGGALAVLALAGLTAMRRRR